MTERLALAGIAIAVVWTVGACLRSRWHGRLTRIAAARSLARSADGLPQIVSFYGPQCDACDTQKRIIRQLQETGSRAASVRFVDAVAEPDFARQFGVLTVPTTIVASASGRIVGITAGVVQPTALVGQLGLAA